MPKLKRPPIRSSNAESSGTATGETVSGVPIAIGTPLSIKIFPCKKVLEVGGGMPSVKSSLNELSACPPAAEMKDPVSVPLKVNEDC